MVEDLFDLLNNFDERVKSGELTPQRLEDMLKGIDEAKINLDYNEVCFYLLGYSVGQGLISIDDSRIIRIGYERCIKMLNNGDNDPFYTYDFTTAVIGLLTKKSLVGSTIRDKTFTSADISLIPEEYGARIKDAAENLILRIKDKEPEIAQYVEWYRKWIDKGLVH